MCFPLSLQWGCACCSKGLEHWPTLAHISSNLISHQHALGLCSDDLKAEGLISLCLLWEQGVLFHLRAGRKCTVSFEGCSCGYTRSKKGSLTLSHTDIRSHSPTDSRWSAEEIHHSEVVLPSLTFSYSTLIIFMHKAAFFVKGKSSQHANSLGICFDSLTLAA